MITKLKTITIFFKRKETGTYVFAPNGAKPVCTLESPSTANTCRHHEVPKLGPKHRAFITRPFLEVNHFIPITDVLLHLRYVNETRHISYTYHVSRCFLQHLHDELGGYSIKRELLMGGHMGRLSVVYKG